MSDIALGFALSKPYSMSDFRNKVLYNTNGTTYTVPSGSVSMSYFRGRYYKDPSPISTTYTSNTSNIIPPSNKPTPTYVLVEMYGGGGSGGGGGGGAGYSAYNNYSGAGGGGGGSGGKIIVYFTYSQQTIDIIVGQGGTGVSGGAGDYNDGAEPGSVGNIGFNSLLILNNSTSARAGGGEGGRSIADNSILGADGGWRGRDNARPGRGGRGGTNSSSLTILSDVTGNNGTDGTQGGNQFSYLSGGSGGAGGNSLTTLNYGKGSGGGTGGGAGNGNGYSGDSSSSGNNGAVILTWYYTDSPPTL
jgi:hypothetical protein